MTTRWEERRAKFAKRRLERLGISPEIQTPITPPQAAIEQPYVDVPIEKGSSSFWDKLGKGASKTFHWVGEKSETYLSDPMRGTVMSFATLLPGEQLGEKKLKEKWSEIEGFSLWSNMQAASEVMKEEYPWWASELVGATNPLYWVSPSGIPGALAKGAGLAGKLAQRGGRASKLAKVAFKTQEGMEAAQHGVQIGENAVVKPIVWPIEKAVGRFPRGRLQNVVAELGFSDPGKIRARFQSWHLDPFDLTREGSRARSGRVAEDVGRAISSDLKPGLHGRTVEEISKKLQRFMDDDVTIREALPNYFREVPKMLKHTQDKYKMASEWFREQTGKDLFETLAMRHKGDEDAFFGALRREVSAADAYRTGLVQVKYMPTARGLKAQKEGLVTGLVKGKSIEADVALIAEKYIIPRPQLQKHNLWYRAHMKIKSGLLYPAMLVGRPGWPQYNLTYGFNIGLYLESSIWKGLPGIRRGTTMLKELGRVPEEASRKGFTAEAMGIGEEALQGARGLSAWEKLPFGTSKPLKAMQKYAEFTEKQQHKLLGDAAFAKHFVEQLPESIASKVAEGKISLELAKQLKGITNKSHLDDFLFRIKNSDEIYAGDVFPRNMLDSDVSRVWDDVAGELFPNGVRSLDDTVAVTKAAEQRLGKYYDEALEVAVLKEGNVQGFEELVQKETAGAYQNLQDNLLDQFPGRTDEINDVMGAIVRETENASEGAFEQLFPFMSRRATWREEFIKWTAGEGERGRLLIAHDAENVLIAQRYMLERYRTNQRFIQEVQSAMSAGVDPTGILETAKLIRLKIGKKWQGSVQKLDDHYEALKQQLDAGKRPRGKDLTPPIGEVEAKNIFKSVLDDKLNPYIDDTLEGALKRSYGERAGKLQRAQEAMRQDWMRPVEGLDERQLEQVYKAFDDAADVAQTRATQDVNTALFNYGEKNTLDFWMQHAIPFPFFQTRHLLSMATIAANKPRQLALFAGMIQSWYDHNADLPESQRLSIATEITLPGGSKVLFRPLAWIQPLTHGILEVISMGEDEEESISLTEMVNVFNNFTGGFVYPNLEIAAGVALPAVGQDRWIQQRYGPFKKPEEALTSLLPQGKLLTNIGAMNSTLAGEMIESDLIGLKLDDAQIQNAIYMLGDMVESGEISQEQGNASAKALRDGIADEWNTKATTKAMSQQMPFKLGQFHGIPITAYTPGWQRSQMLKGQMDTGLSEGMKRVYMPHFYKQLKEEHPSIGITRYIPPTSLSPSMKSEWRQTVDYWHGKDQAKSERQAHQLMLDEAFDLGEIDGPMWVNARKNAYANYFAVSEHFERELPFANITSDQTQDFSRRLGKEASPVHPYRGAVEQYFAIELKDGFPPDYRAQEKARRRYLDSLDLEAAKYVEWYASINMTPMEMMYKNAVRTMRPYFDIEYEVMEEAGLLELYTATRSNAELDRQLNQQNVEYRRAKMKTMKLRRLIRQAYPEIQEAGQKYFGFASMF